MKKLNREQLIKIQYKISELRDKVKELSYLVKDSDGLCILQYIRSVEKEIGFMDFNIDNLLKDTIYEIWKTQKIKL